MKIKQPRLRMLAGPNGSGKSTLKNVIGPRLLGAFINADEFEASANTTGLVNFNDYNITIDHSALAQYCKNHSILKKHGLADDITKLNYDNNSLLLNGFALNSYHASAICNYIREELLKLRESFSFETVMSHESKIKFLEDAQNQGYKTYLYFIAPESADINVVRVQERVEKGGHSVPEDKIRSRYKRSINLLSEAMEYVNRAYIFDNSHDQSEPVLIAEYNGEELIAKVNAIPNWFIETWNKF